MGPTGNLVVYLMMLAIAISFSQILPDFFSSAVIVVFAIIGGYLVNSLFERLISRVSPKQNRQEEEA